MRAIRNEVTRGLRQVSGRFEVGWGTRERVPPGSALLFLFYLLGEECPNHESDTFFFPASRGEECARCERERGEGVVRFPHVYAGSQCIHNVQMQRRKREEMDACAPHSCKYATLCSKGLRSTGCFRHYGEGWGKILDTNRRTGQLDESQE